MAKPKPLPPYEYLHECFSYDPATGTLTWRERPRSHFATANAWATQNSKNSGKIAKYSYHKDGPVRIKFNNLGIFLAHRIIWKMITGKDPVFDIDHKDLNEKNNKWDNLRESTRSQNLCNRAILSTNTSGYKGVHWHPTNKNWVACITFEGITYNLGSFNAPEKAYKAYCYASEKLHKEFGRTV